MQWLTDIIEHLRSKDASNFDTGLAVAIIAAIVVGLWKLVPKLIARRFGLSHIGDTAQIERPVIALPKPTAHYVEDKQLILQIYRAMKDRKGATISGLSGMGGIGKTEAAVVAAWHLLKDGQFKHGAVLIDLQGFADAQESQPMDAKMALGNLIAAVTGKITPAEATEDQLNGLWQHATADKDLLVILDNARDAEQIAPLMPAANGPKVLVTSRNRVQLPDGRVPIEVGKLGTRHANQLVRELAPGLKDQQIDRLIRLSLGLPLLLRTIAATVQRPEKAPDAWLTELEEQGAAAQGEDIDKLRARLAFSIDALGGEDAERYAALSLCPAGFHAQTAYAIWGLEEAPGADVLRRLRDASLLEKDATPFTELLGPRYRLHDYLADSARERFGALHWRTRQAVRHRWGKHALELLRLTDQIFETKGGDMVGLRLFEMEQATIRAAQAWAVEKAEADDTAADLSMRFPNFNLLSLRLTPRERIDWLEAGLPAAKRLGDRAAEARLLGNAGHRYRILGEFETAEARMTESLAIQKEKGDRLDMAKSHGNLGDLYREMGELEKAEKSLEAALGLSTALSREAAERGDQDAQRKADIATANTHGNLGNVYMFQDKFAKVEQSYRATLDIMERLGMRQGMASSYGNLGVLYGQKGRLDEAAAAYDQGLEINTELNNREGMAATNFNLSVLRMQQGQIAQARDNARTARALYAEVGLDHKVAETDALLAEIDEAGG